MADFKVDPVTRIEGHLSVELTDTGSAISNAKCECQLFRGFELILKNRKPTDAPILAQRI